MKLACSVKDLGPYKVSERVYFMQIYRKQFSKFSKYLYFLSHDMIYKNCWGKWIQKSSKKRTLKINYFNLSFHILTIRKIFIRDFCTSKAWIDETLITLAKNFIFSNEIRITGIQQHWKNVGTNFLLDLIFNYTFFHSSRIRNHPRSLK